MLTSPRTNGADHFVPSRHLALMTQPVLGARSRSRRKTTNITIETSTNEQLHSMTNNRRTSFNDSPPLILPINRIDTSQFSKKTNSYSHHESADSGLDLSLSTNSSVQLQQYPQQHIPIHRPLSALNEDSSPDDGYHDEQQQTLLNVARLRFPPVSFARNRSMEDMISDNTREQQHRSSSFSDERQQKLFLHQEQKIQRASDGTLRDLLDSSTEPYRRINPTNQNELLHPSVTQQHRSFNDLTNKTSNKVFPIHNESNTSGMMNNLAATHTIIRKPNTSTLKPLRKKSKLNLILEPSLPLTSSRLAVYNEQINAMTTGTTSSSSNQTTPRSLRPLGQQQIKSKTSTPLDHYTNPELIKAHVNRSVVERHNPPVIPFPARRNLFQQMIPFDASPSKVNNLLLRHHLHPSLTSQLSPSRQIKQNLPTLYNDETSSIVQEEKRKEIKSKEQEDKKRRKQKDHSENNKSNEMHEKEEGKSRDIQEPISSKSLHQQRSSHDQSERTNLQRQLITSNEKQTEEELSLERNRKKKIEKNRLVEVDESIGTSSPLRQYLHHDNGGIDQQQRRTNTNDRYGSGHSNSTTGKPYNSNHIHRRQQRNLDPVHMHRSNGTDGEQPMQKLTTTRLLLQNKTQNYPQERSLSRTSEISNQYGSDYFHGVQKMTPVAFPSHLPKIHLQTFETSTNRRPSIQSEIDQWQDSTNRNDHQPWRISQMTTQGKPMRIEGNRSTSRRERENSRLSHVSKTDSISFDDQQVKQKISKNNSNTNFQSKSPTSWSIIPEHQNYQQQQQLQTQEKNNVDHSDLSISPSSHDELIEDKVDAPSRTYRLTTNDQQDIDGRHVLPSNNFQVPSVIDQSSFTSSRHTHPFACTTDFQISDDTLIENSPEPIETITEKSHTPDVYTLSDHDHRPETADLHNFPSPLVHLSSNKKYSTPPPPPPPTKQITISTEKDEIISNYDSDDGWSDDSAELLYVDERYAKDKRKVTPSSHLSSQQQHYHLQQENVLL